MRTRDLGFTREHLVLIPINEPGILERYATVKEELSRDPNILNTTVTSYFPGEATNRQNYWKEGMGENEYPMIRWIAVDFDFIKTFKLDLKTGRDFSLSFPNDETGAYILNESAAKELGWDTQSAPGKAFKLVEKGTIIGVVKDFNFRSLHQEIEPLVLYIWPESFKYFAVRIQPGNISGAIKHLESVWKKFAIKQPFEYYFLDEQFDQLYKTEMRLGTIFRHVTTLAILIASLGLFGLASFAVERRTKEIGIRKILGSSRGSLVWLLSQDFTRWVLLANIIAWPVSYYAMNRWLQNFAYRKSLSPWIFILSALIVLSVALFTVSLRSFRAATQDPVKILKYE
jgi:putative ABC transport system permease protein